MPDAVSTQHLDVFNQIVSSLVPLDRDAQLHVLRNVASWFDLDIVAAATPPRSVAADLNQPEPKRVSFEIEPSPKAFLLERAPSTNVERIACLAYYLTHFRNTPYFKTFDLSKLNTEAAQPKFTNTSFSVRDAAKLGLLVHGPKGQKQISAIGEQFVLALPEREKARGVLRRMRPRKARKQPHNAARQP